MSERAQRLIELADDELILGWRDSEWTGIAPLLEEDVAFSSIAQNEIGHARALYELAARDLGTTADELAFDREPAEYRCAPLVELRFVPDWAQTIARRVLYEAADELRIEALKADPDAEVAGLAAKIDREEAYHRMHAQMWSERLRGEPRYEAAAEELWPYALGVVEPEQRDELAPARRTPGRRGGRARRPSRARAAVGGDDGGAPLGAWCRVVTEAAVWDALAEIPDPEIPTISLVDLGVVRDVAVEEEPRPRRVHADVPRLPGARGDEGRDGGGDPRRRRRAGGRGRPGRLVVDRPDHARGPREAARVGLRAAGAARGGRADARPADEGGAPLPVLRLDGHAPGEHLRPDPVPLAALLRRAAGSRTSSSRRSRTKRLR